MSTTIEFGNGEEEWYGTYEVKIDRENVITGPDRRVVDRVSIADGHGAEITGTPQDMRRLGFYLIGLTEDVKGKGDNE